MKIGKSDINTITYRAVDIFNRQNSRLFWESPKGKVELTFEEKRILAIVKAVNITLQLDIDFLDINYDEYKEGSE